MEPEVYQEKVPDLKFSVTVVKNNKEQVFALGSLHDLHAFINRQDFRSILVFTVKRQ